MRESTGQGCHVGKLEAVEFEETENASYFDRG
jgi:hypothetical protein